MINFEPSFQLAFQNLADLLDALVPIEPAWATMRTDLRHLTLFAVEVRYPGAFADKAQARDALAVCRMVRQRVRQSLGLTP
jgi:hypothetical protein